MPMAEQDWAGGNGDERSLKAIAVRAKKRMEVAGEEAVKRLTKRLPGGG